MSPSWLWRRMRAMGPAEIAWRLASMVRHAAMRAAPRWAPIVQGSSGPALEIDLGEVDGEARRAITATARSWLEHRGSFLWLRDVDLGPTIDWHRDYASARVAPRRYSAFIDHRDPHRVGDVKVVWELNRLQHLVLLALAGRLEGDDAFRAEVAAQTRGWRQQNPFLTGINWKSPMEAGLRLLSWSFVAAVAPGTLDGDAFVELLDRHQRFVRAFHSRYSSANNHLVAEMVGLYAAATMWPGLAASAARRRYARERLVDALVEQVEADGVHRERAIEYQVFVTELFLTAGALGEAAGDPFPAPYWDRLASMLDFLVAARRHGPRLPAWGDGDGAIVVPPALDLGDRSAALVDLRAAADDGGDIAPTTRLWRRLLLWGVDARRLPLAAEAPPASHLTAFADGGFFFLSDGPGGAGMSVAFDAGELGLAPTFAHGHADALSFCLSWAGREFLIDPGTGNYYADELHRDYLRGTAAHNTV
ncbi:MAG: heparinase II/III family protein, partial [Thermoanaerobaculia bacterium]|nr:heparinase II/III family protein [Thermoanaerobaculia bacterium]